MPVRRTVIGDPVAHSVYGQAPREPTPDQRAPNRLLGANIAAKNKFDRNQSAKPDRDQRQKSSNLLVPPVKSSFILHKDGSPNMTGSEKALNSS